jgi:hypothetical protein
MTSKLAFRPFHLSALLAAVASVVLAGATPAHAQPAPSDVPEDPYDDSDDSDDLAPPDQPSVTPDQAPAPASQPPTAQPPPPQVPQAQAAPGGQWVHTQQYGWVWMPYGNQYVYTPEDTSGSANPYAYVYYPTYGWTWLAAPWVWGWGPHVYFSIGRPGYFGWYHHRHFVGGYRGHGFVRGFRGPVYRGGFVRGYRAPVYRGGFRGGVGHVSGGFRAGGHVSGHGGGHGGGHGHH